jgi:hypothetical protein
MKWLDDVVVFLIHVMYKDRTYRAFSGKQEDG